MKLEVLMATMNKQKIADLSLDERGVKTDILIVNQSDFEGEEQVDSARMYSNTERGSSRSRNLAITKAKGDICLIADDDISYLPGYEKIILDAYARNPDADIITFQIQAPDGEPFKEGYYQRELVHNQRTILKCASIEISFKRDSVQNVGLLLDLDFGLGSRRYRVHDENIFLSDALKKGLKCIYVPIPVVVHPREFSGTTYTQELLESKGAAFARMHGSIGYVLSLVFAVKKRNEYADVFTFRQCLKIMFNGSREYLESGK